MVFYIKKMTYVNIFNVYIAQKYLTFVVALINLHYIMEIIIIDQIVNKKFPFEKKELNNDRFHIVKRILKK